MFNSSKMVGVSLGGLKTFYTLVFLKSNLETIFRSCGNTVFTQVMQSILNFSCSYFPLPFIFNSLVETFFS